MANIHLPTLGEGGNVRCSLDKLSDFLKPNNIGYEVLVFELFLQNRNQNVPVYQDYTDMNKILAQRRNSHFNLRKKNSTSFICPDGSLNRSESYINKKNRKIRASFDNPFTNLNITKIEESIKNLQPPGEICEF